MNAHDLEELDRRARVQIQKQLAASQETLVALGRSGLEPHHVVQLDFSYVAPDRARAVALRDHLQKHDCVDLSVDPLDPPADARAEDLAERRHVVSGRSHPTKLSVPILGQWVPWMVVQGVKHDCEFDGWATEVPEAR